MNLEPYPSSFYRWETKDQRCQVTYPQSHSALETGQGPKSKFPSKSAHFLWLHIRNTTLNMPWKLGDSAYNTNWEFEKRTFFFPPAIIYSVRKMLNAFFVPCVCQCLPVSGTQKGLDTHLGEKKVAIKTWMWVSTLLVTNCMTLAKLHVLSETISTSINVENKI